MAKTLITAEYRKDTSEKIALARYAISRTFTADGQVYGHELECTNPAYGWAIMDDWEDCLIRHLNNPKRHATAKAA